MKPRLFALIKKEFLSIWRDPQSRAIILVPPLLQLFIFAHAVTMEVINIKLGIIDHSQSVESRDLCSRFERSKWFKKIYYLKNEQDLKFKLDNQFIMMGLDIPPDFHKTIKDQKPNSVQIILDGRQTSSASTMNSYATQIIQDFNKDYLKTKGSSVNVEIRNWFNPNLEYLWYTLVTMITILSVATTLLLTALSIARERELGTFEQLIVSPLKPSEILFGKTVPPLILSIIITLIMIFISRVFFKLPFNGNIFLLILSTTISLLSIVGVGLFISSICKTQQQAILGMFTFQTPAVLLSGFVSPIEDMPKFFQMLTWIDPIRFHIAINKGLFLKGMLWNDVFANLIPLTIIAIFTLSAATFMFKAKLD